MQEAPLLPKAKGRLRLPILFRHDCLIAQFLIFLLIVLLSIIVPVCSSAQVLFSGPKSSSAITTGAGNSWTNPTNASSSDASYATYSVATFIGSASATTDDITAKGFAFSIPSTATVLGVKVELQKACNNNSTNNYTQDNTLYLVSGASQTDISSNKADVSTKWGTSSAYYTYGGTTDLWSATLTPAIINSSNFGLRFKATVVTNSWFTTTTAYIDHIRITVYYDIDSDGDGVLNNADLDSDNDGIPDYLEVTTCSGSQSLNWNSVPDGTNPTTVTVTNSPVTMGVAAAFTVGANVGTYEIEDYFTATAEKEIHIHQTPAAYSDKSTTTINFSYPVFGISFKMQDLDYQAGTWIDSVKVTLSYKGQQFVLSASQVTTSLYNTYKGNNVFLGVTGNSADNSTNGQVTINFPYMVDKVVVEYWNNDAAHGAQRFGIGGFTFCHLSSADTDGDGIINSLDLDSDNDGIPDVVESYGVDVNGDGRIDNFTDTDGDGLSQNIDANNTGANGSGSGLGLQDFDGDGIANYIDLDCDGDGIPDIIEVQGTDSNNDGKIDSFTDADSDGLHDSVDGDVGNDGTVENGASTLLRSGSDTNSDGIADSWTYKNIDQLGKPNPYDLDSDGDGILDMREAGFSGTNGVASGTLGSDGWSDTIDALASLGIPNSDASGLSDPYDIDSDNDGITDNVEAQATSSYKVPTDTDSDNDGICDVFETAGQIGTYGGNGLTPYDYDSDGIPDYKDTDSDNDGAPDRNEGDRNVPFATIVQATIDASGDADGDGLMDVFDNLSITLLSAGTYYKNVTMGNMGPLGNFAGPTPTSSLIGLQQSDPSADRDWRNLSILPLHIVNFAANYQSPFANISWDVVNELQTSYYEVEMSIDGTIFLVVNKVDAKNLGRSSYSFAHSPNALQATVLYYRVKQVDKDGRFYYTKTIAIRLNRAVLVNAGPNPFVSYVNVSFQSNGNERAIIRLVSLDGKIVGTKVIDASKGLNTVQLDGLVNLPSASYVLQLQIGTLIQTLAMVKR